MSNELINKVEDLEIRGGQVNGAKEENDEDVVDPWNVVSKSQTGIDYDKLISKFFAFCNF